MDKQTRSTGESRLRHWWRVLRPLAWWVLLVLLLFAVREHQVWSERTRLHFRVMLGKEMLNYEADATVDGKPFTSGQRISLGKHLVNIRHPKTEPFATNLHIWYGSNDLGQIVLKRSQGKLQVSTMPAAARLIITGEEFQTNLANSSGLTVMVPTGRYEVECRYAHSQEKRLVDVRRGMLEQVTFTPQLGVLRIAANREGVAFTLANSTGQRMATGTVPSTVPELPAGVYHITAAYHGDERSSAEIVKAGETNTVMINFVYGAVRIETKPAGAAVISENGREYGQTPLTLPEMAPGNWVFTLRLRGYLPVVIPLEVSANRTNAIQTNLVNEAYANAMGRARRALAQTNLPVALLAAKEAERIEPGDVESLAIQKQVEMIQNELLAKAKEKEEAVKAMQKLAAEAEAKRQAELRQQERVKAEEKQRLEAAAKRALRAKEYFGEWMKKTEDSELFDQQEMVVRGDLAEIEAKLIRALTNEKPAFKITVLEHPEPGLFQLLAVLESAGGTWRRCDLVGGQSKDGEVTVVFKVFEYADADTSILSFRLSIGGNAQRERKWVPIHSLRLPQEKRHLLQRREEGVQKVRDRIETANGQ